MTLITSRASCDANDSIWGEKLQSNSCTSLSRKISWLVALVIQTNVLTQSNTLEQDNALTLAITSYQSETVDDDFEQNIIILTHTAPHMIMLSPRARLTRQAEDCLTLNIYLPHSRERRSGHFHHHHYWHRHHHHHQHQNNCHCVEQKNWVTICERYGCFASEILFSPKNVKS